MWAPRTGRSGRSAPRPPIRPSPTRRAAPERHAIPSRLLSAPEDVAARTPCIPRRSARENGMESWGISRSRAQRRPSCNFSPPIPPLLSSIVTNSRQIRPKRKHLPAPPPPPRDPQQNLRPPPRAPAHPRPARPARPSAQVPLPHAPRVREPVDA